jgi:hypothetical protein
MTLRRFFWIMLAAPGVVAATLLAICVVALVLFQVWKLIDNAQFAREFFEDKVEIVRVVASKRWHDFFDQAFACTFAVVEFSDSTAAKLRAEGPRALIGKGWLEDRRERWNPPWVPTPDYRIRDKTFKSLLNETKPTLGDFNCLTEFQRAEATLIFESLQQEGAWYFDHHFMSGFLSADHRLAAIMRFGD